MKTRIAALLLACLLPGVAGAWVELGTHYLGAETQFQLGDICDTARFPLTPGTCSGAAGNPNWVVEIQEAVSRWHGSTANFHYFTDPGDGASTPGTCDAADPNSLFFLDDICGLAAFGDTTLAVALTSFFFDGIALHSDVIFNTAFQWGAYDDALTNHGDVIDIRRVAVHELGHVAGLGHPSHDLAIMSAFIQDAVIVPQPDDIAGMNAIYGVSLAFAIPDQNGNSRDELVHVWRKSSGETMATVTDSSTSATLRTMTYFSSGFQTVDAVLLPDQDDSGAPELAILAIRLSDLRPIVQIKNISGPENLRQVGYSLGLTPIRLRNVGDADGNGAAELAVLATRESDLASVVEMRNSIGSALQRLVIFESAASALDLEVVIDPLGVDAPRLCVMLFKWPDGINPGRGFLDFRNGFGAKSRTRTWLRPDTTPVAMHLIDEAGPRVAVVSSRDLDGRPLVEIKNPFGTTGNSFGFYNGANQAINISSAGDADGDGRTDIIVLARRLSDGRTVVEERNTDGSNPRLLSFASTFDSIGSVFPLDDTDGDTFPELAVLMSKQLDARAGVYWRNAAGPDQVTTTRIWVAPPP